MNIREDNITPLLRLVQQLRQPDIRAARLLPAIEHQFQVNSWFTPSFCELALQDAFSILEDSALKGLPQPSTLRTIALVPANNIPLQALPDVLRILLHHHHVVCKLPERETLLPFIIELLLETVPDWKNRIQFCNKIPHCDAIIADVTTEQLPVFKQYFPNTPLLLRPQQGITAVLTGYESTDKITSLVRDMWIYFGKGPNAVRKLLVPNGYEFSPLRHILHDDSQPIAHHNQFLNHLEYQRAVRLMNQQPFLDAGTFLLAENPSPEPPISVIHYEYYHELPATPKSSQSDISIFIGQLA